VALTDALEARACAQRLITLIQLLIQTRPAVVLEIERSVKGIVTNDVRQQIAERLARFSVADVRIVEALTAHLDERQASNGGQLHDQFDPEQEA
jgi:transcription termination factor Rho